MGKVTDFKNYMGDINLEYGGYFYDLSEWKYDYVPVLRVEDLDSACGFNGAAMVERLTVILPRDKHELESVLSVCGWEDQVSEYWHSREDRLKKNLSHSQKVMLVDACLSYGLYDPDQGSYYSVDPRYPQGDRMTPQYMIIIQTESDDFDGYYPMIYDGWKADVRLSEDQDLFNYLLSEGYLSEFE